VIEIVITPTGDIAFADTEQEACLAARTLLREASQTGCGRPTAAFYTDGVLVREGVTRREV
jgi:hypothetical protein